jgi:tRNA pseudouridine55 synthase
MLGIINIDKPSGCTSHDIVAFVRLLSGRKIKVGHSGTLDPLATGVLPVFVGKATRLIQYIPSDTKKYIFTTDLSIRTDSADAEGNVIERFLPDPIPSRSDLERAALNFTGDIKQKAPMFSAVSIDGTRLYKLARQGKVVERPFRDVNVSSLKLLNYEYPLAQFEVACSRGTYVRTLAEDIGAFLNVGGCVMELRRTYSGGLFDDTSLTPFEVASILIKSGFEGLFSPFDMVFGKCATARISKETLSKVTNGVQITEEEIEYIKNEDETGKVLLFSSQNNLVAMYRKTTVKMVLVAEKVLL